MRIQFADDDSFTVTGTPASIPEGWIKDGDRYSCAWPPCYNRLISRRVEGDNLIILASCARHKCPVDLARCNACDVHKVPVGPAQPMQIETPEGLVIGQAKYYQVPGMAVQIAAPYEPTEAGAFGPEHPAPSPPASMTAMRLSDLDKTLPPFVEGRDRPLHIEPDGTIVYDKRAGDWEPPRDIDGYQRDPNDPFIFHPLWKSCALRLQVGVRLANCGCIQVRMRCNNPAAELGKNVKYTDCEACKVRVEET